MWLCMHSSAQEPKECLHGCSRALPLLAGTLACEGLVCLLHIHPAMVATVTQVHLQGIKVGCAEAVHARRMSTPALRECTHALLIGCRAGAHRCNPCRRC